MHQPFTDETISARFSFRPDRAEEFLEEKDENDNWVYNGQTVTERDYESVEELMTDVNAFSDALLDVNAIINGQVINLVDYSEEA